MEINNNSRENQNVAQSGPTSDSVGNRKNAETNSASSQNQDEVDAQRGDNDDFTTNGLDEGNTMGNDDDVSEARESGTK